MGTPGWNPITRATQNPGRFKQCSVRSSALTAVVSPRNHSITRLRDSKASSFVLHSVPPWPHPFRNRPGDTLAEKVNMSMPEGCNLRERNLITVRQDHASTCRALAQRSGSDRNNRVNRNPNETAKQSASIHDLGWSNPNTGHNLRRGRLSHHRQL